ncbi:hypothetical protein ACQPTN_05915 [Bradyrhizobium sp. 13971]
MAAEVDLRILTAACEWFLARELAGVSVEEIACRASKATVYTRFPDQRGAGCRDHPAQLGNSAERIGKAPSSGMLEERLTVLEDRDTQTYPNRRLHIWQSPKRAAFPIWRKSAHDAQTRHA